MTDDSQTPDITDITEPVRTLARGVWWFVLIRGIFAVIFGLIAVFSPLIAGFAVVFVFATYAVLEGIVEIVHAIQTRSVDRRWGWLLAMGIISVVAGVVAFVFPPAALLVYGSFGLALIAFWAVLTGIAGFPAAASQSGGRRVLGYIVAALSVVLGVVLAIILIADPLVAIRSLIWVVGIWAIVSGITLIVAAISVRVGSRPAGSGSAAAPAQG